MGCTNQKSIILSNGKKLYFTNESEKYKVIFVIKNPCSHKESSIYKQICEEFNYNYLSTGDILERICSEKSQKKEYENIIEKVKNGDLITSKEMVNILKNEIIKFDNYKYILIDGFPRNYEQAVAYDDILKKVGYDLGIIIVMEVDQDILEKRITGRRVCKNCGSVFNINNDLMKPKNESICDNCGGDLYQRSDDNLEAFKNRFATYEKNTEKIINHYKDLGVLHFIDGNRTIEEISKQIDEIIKEAN